MTTESKSWNLEYVAFLSLAIGLGAVQFNIITCEVFLDLAGLLWLVIAIRERRWPDTPAFFLPLLIYAGITIVGAVFSVDPMSSLARCKQLLWLLIVPGTMRLARGDRAATALNIVMALGAFGAIVGVIEYALWQYGDPGYRSPGFLGHYMTFAGLIMLVLCAAVANVAFDKRPRVWPAIAIPALAAALGVTLARNAWVGAACGIAALLALRNLKLLLLLPVVIGLAVVVAPAHIQSRITSIFDRNDPTTRDRGAMLEAGVHIVEDHPILGVGINMIPVVWPQYRPPDAVDPVGVEHPTRSHLHNVPMQIAAERGLPALAVWLWFIIVALRDLIRQTRRGIWPAIAAAGVAAIVAMLTAGLAEYNFGDSEFLILFLGLITLPFAAAHAAGARKADA